MQKIKTVEELNEIKQLPYSVIIFSAEWCNACTEVKPILTEVEPTTQIPFYEIDVDSSPDIKDLMRIKAIPMILFLRNDKVSEFIYGATTIDKINHKLQMLKRHD